MLFCGIKEELSQIFEKNINSSECLRVLCSPKLVDYSELLKTEMKKNNGKPKNKPIEPEPTSQ